MPLIEISVAAGRDEPSLRDLMARVHDAVEQWGAPAQSIRVVVREVPPTLWLSGGVTLAEKKAAAS